MSEAKMKDVVSLLYHALRIIEASAGINVDGCRVQLGDFDLVLDKNVGEVTICEAKKTFELERL